MKTIIPEAGSTFSSLHHNDTLSLSVDWGLAMAGVVLAMVFVRPIVDFIADHMGREAALNALGGHVWGSGCGARSARCSRRSTGPVLYKNC